MNLRQLEYFVRVAELGGFSKAAQSLNIAQPALSRQVRLLETGLQRTLLRRHGRGAVLTEAGQRLFDHGVAILDRVADAEEDMSADRDEPLGRIVVGMPPTLGRQLTLPLIEGFRSRLPKARLTIVEGFSTHIVEWITGGRVDLGVVYNPEAQPAIEIVPVLEETLHLVQAAAARPRGPLPLRELSGFALIVPERLHALRRLLETRAALAGVRLDIAWEVSSVPAIIDMVCAGYGYAVLTASAAAVSGRSAELAVRPIVEPAVTSVVCLATPANRLALPLARHTAMLLTELLRGLPRADGARTARP
jgi:LysR family nitrogen assimilation transcriptional regulator